MILTKRSFSFIGLAYVVTFLFGIVLSIAFGFDPASNPEQIANPPLVFCLATIVISAVVSAIATYYFFTYNKPKIKPTTQFGLKFGVTMVAVGFVLDLILFLPIVFSMGSVELLLAYYGKWYFIVALTSVVAAAAGVGYWLENQRKN